MRVRAPVCTFNHVNAKRINISAHEEESKTMHNQIAAGKQIMICRYNW